MKKILLTFILSLSLFLSMGLVNAQTVIVTEKVPGADCVCIQGVDAGWKIQYDATDLACRWAVTVRKYECTIETGLAGFQNMFATIIRWLVNIVMLAGVLAIVWLGIAWSLAGGDDAKAKSELKKWWMNILIGMIILFFFRYILQFLAPWIYK